MKPYYQRENVTLYHGDCLEVMSTLPDGAFDAVITDPPYGTTACKWDAVIPFEPMWAQLKRLIKPRGAIVLFGSQPFTSALIMSNPKMFKYVIIWDKVAPGNPYLSRVMPLKIHEDICIFGDGAVNYNPQRYQGEANHKRRGGFRAASELFPNRPPDTASDTSGQKLPKSIVGFPKHTSRENLHPTQKPVALMEYLIKTYTNEGETVLDFTVGSGTTGVACIRTGRQFTGIELEERYCEIAAARFDKELNQGQLFAAREIEPVQLSIMEAAA